MNYKILANDYVNTGGNCMVLVSEVWLKDENKTVYVFTADEHCVMSTVDYIRKDLEVDDYDEFIVEAACFTDADHADCCTYFEIYRDCVFEYLRRDCGYFNYRFALPFEWLLPNYQLQITAAQRQYVSEEYGGAFATDGTVVYVEQADGEPIELLNRTTYGSLRSTLSSCLYWLQATNETDSAFLDPIDHEQLLQTIQDVSYWMDQITGEK